MGAPMNHNLQEQARKLKLPYISEHIERHIEYAEEENESFSSFLSTLFDYELALRQENSIKRRIKQAKFPYHKYLDELKLEALPEEAQKAFNHIKRLQFITDRQNIVMAGNPGTGKTHLAIGLGIKAAQEGFKVYFAHVPSLIVELKESQNEKKLSTFKRKIAKYDLIILDELGYVSFDKTGAELLFNMISQRSEKASTIITTNLSFDRWDEIFHDTVITAAIVDRITHRSYILNMNGTSYRYRVQESYIKAQSN